MADLIENPILRSPYRMPTRHFGFDDGITSAIADGRRPSSFFSSRSPGQGLRGLSSNRKGLSLGGLTEC